MVARHSHVASNGGWTWRWSEASVKQKPWNRCPKMKPRSSDLDLSPCIGDTRSKEPAVQFAPSLSHGFTKTCESRSKAPGTKEELMPRGARPVTVPTTSFI